MTKRIFGYMILLSVIILLAALALVAVMVYDSGLPIRVWDLVLPLLIVLGIGSALAAVLAYRLSKAIMRPLEELDPDRLQAAPAYRELQPLVQKIARQNLTIRDQLLNIGRRQEEFKAIAQNMAEGLLVVDRQGEVLSYNSAALRLLDVNPVAADQNVRAWHKSRHFHRAVEKAIAGEHNQQQMSADHRTYQLIANPVNKDGKTVGAVLLILDVTEREERDRLRQEFSANVSHELKTPLTSISGFAEIMMNGVAKPEDMRRFAGSIYQEAQRMIRLVGDIIQLSRLDEKDLTEEMAPVALLDLTRRVVERFADDARRKGVTVSVQGDACTVDGVPQILEEMIGNLCDNAIKYNREGGLVTVAITRRADGVLLAVTDTGIGIPYEEQERVFERFFRGDKSHSRQIGGTGLGLSIVKHGALFHHADLQLESKPGKGTSITLKFPRPMQED